MDNAQETFGLAVAEAMAAGLPLVASDWSGYRDLVRDGIDGYLDTQFLGFIGFIWFQLLLGWQQFTGIQSFPAVAGALAQLVQIDMAAAEMALAHIIESTRHGSCDGICRCTQGP